METKKERFLHEVGPAILAVAYHHKIDPKLLIAQAALETGWGQYVTGNNYFNIKGEGQEIQTIEYVNGKPVKIKDRFRTYPTPLESFVDYIRLIKTNPRYELARYLFHSPGDYFVALQKAGYATDPNYAAKCLAVYASIPENWLEIILDALLAKLEDLI